jgi:hypothetical protein
MYFFLAVKRNYAFSISIWTICQGYVTVTLCVNCSRSRMGPEANLFIKVIFWDPSRIENLACRKKLWKY